MTLVAKIHKSIVIFLSKTSNQPNQQGVPDFWSPPSRGSNFCGSARRRASTPLVKTEEDLHAWIPSELMGRVAKSWSKGPY